LTSPYSLNAATDQDSYAMGAAALITATLEKSGAGLSGQTVTAIITNQHGTQAIVPLTDQGNGTYTNTYLIPAIPGYMKISIDADGNDGGTTFTRHTNLQVTIQPEDAEYTGTHGETGSDANLDGLYETLDFETEINASKAGTYALSADLYAGDQFVAHAGDFFNLISSTQSISLSFNGTAIRDAGLNGPYTVTHVQLVPTDLGLLTASVDNALDTAAYDYTEFGICYSLTLTHTGTGVDPSPAPANSTGCAAGRYVNGETINLSASPATGWGMGSWEGTNDDAGVSLTNALTMPENDSLVTVNYSDAPPMVVSSVRVNSSPTNLASEDFTVTFSEAVTGVDTSFPFNDLALTVTGVTGASITSVTLVSDTKYTVAVNTGTGSGTIRLDIPVGASITDLSENPLAGLPYTSGESYTVVKNLGVASGIVQRQGMPATPDLSPNSMLCSSVTVIGAETYGPLNTDGNGAFQFSDQPEGKYTFRAAYPGYLASEKTGVSVSATTIDLGITTLRGGDVNGDNAINIFDVVKIVNKFGQSGVAVRGATCSDPDEAADINNDGLVNIRDLTITTGNWGLVGPQPWQP
jgi:hypothetical protein